MTILTSLWRWLAVCLLSGLLSVTTTVSHAQEADIDTQFKKVTPEEEARLKAILAEPLMTDALKTTLERQVNMKRMAAKRLSRPDMEESVLREAIPLLQENFGLQSDLANIYRNRGEYARAVELHRALLPQTSRVQKPFYMMHVANDYLAWGKLDHAQHELDQTNPIIESLQHEQLGQGGQRMLLRGISYYNYVLSLLEQRRGRWNPSIEAALRAEQAARKVLSIDLAGDQARTKQVNAMDVGEALARKTQAYRTAGRFIDAEQSLREYIRFSSEAALPAKYRSGIFSVASSLRFGQREFAQAEQLARKSDQILEELGEDATSPNRTSRRRDIFIAFAGQKKWGQALQELRRLDELASGNETLKKRVQFGFDRAYDLALVSCSS